jgi:hypothetical protein
MGARDDLAISHYWPIETWHFVISGFRQHLDRPTGSQLLWSKLRNAHSNGSVCVELREWNSDWNAIAEFVWRFRPAHAPPRVFVYAYSWGAGWGFVRLARELARRGLSVECAVLADAVYRARWISLSWLSLVGLPHVRVPRNVREVYWYFQRRSLPRGHAVVAEDPRATTVHPGIECQSDHSWMDDDYAYHARALEVARKAHAVGR